MLTLYEIELHLQTYRFYFMLIWISSASFWTVENDAVSATVWIDVFCGKLIDL